jgi:hypothetical protein
MILAVRDVAMIFREINAKRPLLTRVSDPLRMVYMIHCLKLIAFPANNYP